MSSHLKVVMVLVLVGGIVPSSFGDTLFKKKTPVAVGYGNASKSTVYWSDCDKKLKNKYLKPPYWFDKGDNCKLTAEGFGLRMDNGRFVVNNQVRFSTLFPDAQLGDLVAFHVERDKGVVSIASKGRMIRLAYASETSVQDLISNGLSIALAFRVRKDSVMTAEALEDVVVRLDDAAVARIPAGGSFFVSTYKSLLELKTYSEVSKVSQSAAVALASYRSALEPAPANVRWPPPRNSIPIGGHDVEIGFSYADFGDGGEGFVLKPGATRVLVHDSFLRSGSQTLDGINWFDDTFVNMRIRYSGGYVYLKNVRFVNCTFEIIDSPRGDEVLGLAVLKLPSLLLPITVGKIDHKTVESSFGKQRNDQTKLALIE